MFALAPQSDRTRRVPWQTISGLASLRKFTVFQAFGECWLLSFDHENDLHDALKLVSAGVAQRLSDLPQLRMLLPGYVPVEHQTPERLVLILEIFIFIFQFHHALGMRRWNCRYSGNLGVSSFTSCLGANAKGLFPLHQAGRRAFVLLG